MRKKLTGIFTLLLLFAVTHTTVFAADLQAIWDKGMSALDLITLIAGILFVIAVVLILFAVMTEKKAPAMPEQHLPQPELKSTKQESATPEDEPVSASEEPVETAEELPEEEAVPEEAEQGLAEPLAPQQEDEDFPSKPNLSFELTLTGVNNNDQFTVLLDRPIHLGRKADNDIVLADTIISGKHAVLLRENDRVYVEDKHSTNGTYINTVRIHGKAELVDGDTLQLGERRYNISF